MEKTKMSKKQFVIYMTVAFGLAWILEIIASIFSNNGNQMIFTSILMKLIRNLWYITGSTKWMTYH